MQLNFCFAFLEDSPVQISSPCVSRVARFNTLTSNCVYIAFSRKRNMEFLDFPCLHRAQEEGGGVKKEINTYF